MNKQKQETNAVDNINHQQSQELQSYFKRIKASKQIQASSLVNIPEGSVQEELAKGDLNIDESNARPFTKEDKLLIKPKKSQKQERKQKINKNLEYLNKQYYIKGKKSQNQISLQTADLMVFSRKEHINFMKKVSNKKHSLTQIKTKQQELKKSKISLQKQKKIKKEEQEREKEMEKIKEREHKLQENKEKLQQKFKDNQQANKKIAELKNKKYLHDKIEEKYKNEIELPILEEKKKKLKQIRELKKPIDYEQLRSHEDEYLKNRQKQLQNSQVKMQELQFDYKKPHKSERLMKILQDENTKLRQEKEEKRRIVEEKQRKKKEFINQLRQRTPPKISKKKRKEIEKIINGEKRIQTKDNRIIGLGYLEAVGRKKRSAHSQLSVVSSKINESQVSKPYTNYLQHNKDTEYYENIRKKRLQKILKSQEYENEYKIKMLKMETQRIEQERQRKQKMVKTKDGQEGEEIEILVSSLANKMNLLSLLNPQ